MKSVEFEYFRPQSATEACAALEEAQNGRLIAGGQTLVPMMAMRLARPTLLIDISRIEEMRGISSGKTEIMIGACTRQVEAERSLIVVEHLPLLAKALPWVGHQPTRNRGTIGGSIANADASAEIPLVLATLEGTIDVIDSRGEHEVIESEELFIGPMMTTIPEEACLQNVRFPVWQGKAIGSGFCEISSRRSDFALVSAATQISLSEDGRCQEVALGLGGVGDIPLKIDISALEGEDYNDDRVRQITAAIVEDIETFDDLHASRTYRIRAAKELAYRALKEAWREAAEIWQGVDT